MNIKPQITISPAALEENVPEKPSPKIFQDGLLSPHIKAKGMIIQRLEESFLTVRESRTVLQV